MVTHSRKYSACLFDLYQTLVYLDKKAYRKKKDTFASVTKTSGDEFTKKWESLVERSNLGQFPRTEDRVIEALKLTGVAADASIAHYVAEVEHRFLREHSILFDGSVELLNKLRRLNVKLGMVTNASPSVWEVIRARQLEPLFDTIVVSSEVGIRKPDPGIYDEALRRLNVWASETAFVGDGNDRELEGAHLAGFTTVRINHTAFQASQSEQSSDESVDFVTDSLSQIPQLLNLENGPT